ncbi:MAG: TonB-dependent receptor plug domain-containing protein [Gemmatimonadota bacterium]
MDDQLMFAGRVGPILFGLVASGILAPGLLAQGTGNVLGRISSGVAGANLANALVSISGTELKVLSGDEGWFFLTGIPAGRHEITVELPGFAEVKDTIEVGPDAAVKLDFLMAPDPVPVDELVVSAEGRAIGTLAHRRVIGRDEIERRGPSTVTQLLQGLVPGVTQTVTSGDVGSAAQIRIRGTRSLEASPPLFFVDGIRIGSSRVGGPPGTGGILTFLDNINPRDIDRIEVLHAAEATTLFGTDAVGGAILIFTKR